MPSHIKEKAYNSDSKMESCVYVINYRIINLFLVVWELLFCNFSSSVLSSHFDLWITVAF